MPVPLFGNTPLKCTMGVTPAPMVVPPLPGVPTYLGEIAMAGAFEVITGENIPSFGVCNSPANPATASLTAAAQGVLTPGPCVFVAATLSWTPPNALLRHASGQAVPGFAICQCAYGGTITQAPLPLPINTTP